MTDKSVAEQQIVSLEEGESILGPALRDRLNRCIQHGWDVWKKDYAHKHHILGARVRAAIVFDEIVFCAVQEFSGESGVIVKRTPSSFMLYIGDRITLRFKKIKKNGRCSNIKTRQQVLFLAQMRFPTMLEGTLVHAGYTLDELQQEIVRKSIVCQLDNRVLWQIPLSGDNAAIVELEPATPLSPIRTNESRARFEAKPELIVDVPTIKAIGEKD